MGKFISKDSWLRHRRTLLVFAFFFVIIGFAVILAIDSLHEPTPAEVRLRVAHSPWPSFDIFLLGERGRLHLPSEPQQAPDLRFAFHRFTELFDSSRAFETHNTDVTLMTPYEMLLSLEAGQDPVIFLMTDFSAGADGLVAQPEITSLQDLKGKRIGVEVGTIAHFFLHQALEQGGLKESDVTIVNIGINDLLEAFQSRKIDATATWEPKLSQLAHHHKGRILFTSRSLPDGSVPSVLVAHRSVLETRKDDLKELVRRWDAHLSTYTNVAKVKEYAHQQIALHEGLPQDVVALQLKGVQIADLAENHRQLSVGEYGMPPRILASIRKFESFLREQHMLTKPVQLESLITDEALEVH